MLSTVLKDKEKIEQIIEEPDRYLRDALKTTWEKVNGYTRFPESDKYTGRHPATLAASSWSSRGTLRSSSLPTAKT
jgi:hypothetical protein